MPCVYVYIYLKKKTDGSMITPKKIFFYQTLFFYVLNLQVFFSLITVLSTSMVSVIHDLRISNLVFEYTDKIEQKNYSCLAVADYRFLNILKLKDRDWDIVEKWMSVRLSKVGSRVPPAYTCIEWIKKLSKTNLLSCVYLRERASVAQSSEAMLLLRVTGFLM